MYLFLSALCAQINPRLIFQYFNEVKIGDRKSAHITRYQTPHRLYVGAGFTYFHFSGKILNILLYSLVFWFFFSG